MWYETLKLFTDWFVPKIDGFKSLKKLSSIVILPLFGSPSESSSQNGSIVMISAVGLGFTVIVVSAIQSIPLTVTLTK